MVCYRDKDYFVVTEPSSHTNIQALLTFAGNHLLMYLSKVLGTLNKEESSVYTKVSKPFLTLIYFMLLQFVCSTIKKVISQNPTPSSHRYCQPVTMIFAKEG